MDTGAANTNTNAHGHHNGDAGFLWQQPTTPNSRTADSSSATKPVILTEVQTK